MSGPSIRPLAEVLDSWDDLVDEWRLHPVERSMLIGGFEAGPVDDIDTYRLLCGEARMRLLVEVAPVLRRFHGGPVRTRRWLRRPNPNLGGRVPLDVMSCSPEWIRWLIDHVGSDT